jgi:hypothetical protein
MTNDTLTEIGNQVPMGARSAKRMVLLPGEALTGRWSRLSSSAEEGNLSKFPK